MAYAHESYQNQNQNQLSSGSGLHTILGGGTVLSRTGSLAEPSTPNPIMAIDALAPLSCS